MAEKEAAVMAAAAGEAEKAAERTAARRRGRARANLEERGPAEIVSLHPRDPAK